MGKGLLHSSINSRAHCLWNAAHGLGFAQLWYFWMRKKVQLHFQPKMGEEQGSQNILLDTGSQLGLWSVWRILSLHLAEHVDMKDIKYIEIIEKKM